MKNIIIIFLLLSTFVYTQQREHLPEGRENILQLKPTIFFTPKSDSFITVYYMYRIPYKLLIFQKNGNSFSASVRIMVEIYNDDDLIKRDFKDERIEVSDFEITKNQFAAYQGFITFNLLPDDFTIKGMINDINSKREISLLTEEISGADSEESGILNVTLIDKSANCSGNKQVQLVNYGGSIPFSPSDYQLLISVADTSIESITIKINNNGDDLYDDIITDSNVLSLVPVECNGKLFLENENDNLKTKNFIVDGFSRKLSEGILELTVNTNYGENEKKFQISVDWFNKPYSLRNPEFAIEMLQYIEKNDVVKQLLDVDEEEYPKVLTDYWKQYDPTPDTKYNELMEEFYSRIDYAAMEFRNIGKKNGVSTDRGKIYIKFGSPDKIERSSNALGYVVETWTYENVKQKFQFVDKQGTGNFILIEG